MTRKSLDGLTKEQLQEREKQLLNETEQLEKVIEASNTTVFDLLIGEVKKEMEDNIAEEEWKKLKENQKKIESYRNIEKALQNQEDLLERKQEELEDVRNALKYYQKNIFEQDEEQEEQEAVNTGFVDEEGNDFRTGDVYGIEDSEYYLIKKSISEGKFAIISNVFEDELLLNYPKNREILENADYIGNIYLGSVDDEEIRKQTEDALNALKIIADSQTSSEENKEVIVAGDGGVFNEDGQQPCCADEEEEG
jgi:hypothetical protein